MKSEALPVGTGRIRRTARSGQAMAEPQNEQHTAAAKRTLEIIPYIDLALLRFCLRLSPAGTRANISFVGCNDLEHELYEGLAVVLT